MRVHFDNVSFTSQTGPNTFAKRLAEGLILAGHSIEQQGLTADVSLVFIEPSGAPLAPRVVQRLDGIWFKPDQFQTHNVGIRALYDKADAVIWQSEFDMKMTWKWWGGRPGNVIHNGINLSPVTSLMPELAKIRQTYDQVFVCASNWHPQKRLRANLELFDHIRQTSHPNSCMIVMGSNPDVFVPHPNIFYTDSQPHDICLQVYAMANWMIHLAWADHCPNVVVESLSQGTPVICSEVGGTKELIGQFGIVLREQPYDFELADYDNPPPIDVKQISTLPNKFSLGLHADINMDHVVEAYVKQLEKVMNP